MRADRIPEIKARVDLESVVTADAGPPARVLSGSLWWHCPLPDHRDRHPSFQVVGERWRCWSGQHAPRSSGDVIDYVRMTRNLSVSAAIDLLAEEAALAPLVPSPPARAGSASPDRFHVDRSHVVDPERASSLMGRYLLARCLPPEAATALGLAVVSDAHHIKRVRHPWEGAASTTTSYWADRAVDQKAEPRWMYRGGHIPSPYLSCTLANPGRVTICEGISDAALMHLAYPDEAICGIPGSAWQRDWASLLARRDVHLVTDADPPGDALRRRVVVDLRRAGARSCTSIRLDEAANDLCGVLKRSGDLPVFRARWEALVEQAETRRRATLRTRACMNSEDSQALAQ